MDNIMGNIHQLDTPCPECGILHAPHCCPSGRGTMGTDLRPQPDKDCGQTGIHCPRCGAITMKRMTAAYISMNCPDCSFSTVIQRVTSRTASYVNIHGHPVYRG